MSNDGFQQQLQRRHAALQPSGLFVGPAAGASASGRRSAGAGRMARGEGEEARGLTGTKKVTGICGDDRARTALEIAAASGSAVAEPDLVVYEGEIHASMRRAEAELAGRGARFDAGAKYLRFRNILVDWMGEVGEEFGLSNLTVHTAVQVRAPVAAKARQKFKCVAPTSPELDARACDGNFREFAN